MRINSAILFSLLFIFYHTLEAQDNLHLVSKLKSIPDLVAFWDFKEKQGENRESFGKNKFFLIEDGGKTPRVKDGPLSGYSARFSGHNYLRLPNENTGALNIFGTDGVVSVLAWIKWQGNGTGFIGGMWNEFESGGQRQYGLFVSLPYYNGNNQVCGHISKSGKPTHPFPYSIDYSASKQIVEKEKWQFIAFTYDGRYIRSYYNGEFRDRDPELINHTIGLEGYPKGLVQAKNPYYFPYGMGNNGSDFTVGAVSLHSGMGNFFKGLIGGLAVFDRCLTDIELSELGEVSNFAIESYFSGTKN